MCVGGVDLERRLRHALLWIRKQYGNRIGWRFITLNLKSESGLNYMITRTV